jgi:hypothetical protein
MLKYHSKVGHKKSKDSVFPCWLMNFSFLLVLWDRMGIGTQVVEFHVVYGIPG